MKNFTFVLIALAIPALAFADCASRAEQAAVDVSSGGRRNSLDYDGYAKYVKHTPGGVQYKVEVRISSNEGYTEELPSEWYLVSARGTDSACKIMSVRALTQ